jgi:hypothetical protein
MSFPLENGLLAQKALTDNNLGGYDLLTVT